MGKQRPGNGSTAWELKTKKVASEWMDAGHAVWFRSMFSEFVTAMDQKEYVGRSALDALRCIELHRHRLRVRQ